MSNGWLYGMWMLGNNYRSKMGYYGEYPPQYLKRIKAMFLCSEKVLHAFSGCADKGYWENEVLVDVRDDVEADIVCSVEELPNIVKEGKFDLILADPPYSGEDAEHYGCSMINRKKCLSALGKICNGYIVWLDQMMPMYRKDEMKLVGTIGMIRSTNHRFRVISIFKVVNDG